MALTITSVVAVFFVEGPSETGKAACVAYAIASTFFLGAQLYGFVLSQVRYSHEIEEPKFELLRLEEAEWGR